MLTFARGLVFLFTVSSSAEAYDNVGRRNFLTIAGTSAAAGIIPQRSRADIGSVEPNSSADEPLIAFDSFLKALFDGDAAKVQFYGINGDTVRFRKELYISSSLYRILVIGCADH